ncbi:hypothetical protein JCM11491_006692 [Sporobolomyces phaffii]
MLTKPIFLVALLLMLHASFGFAGRSGGPRRLDSLSRRSISPQIENVLVSRGGDSQNPRRNAEGGSLSSRAPDAALPLALEKRQTGTQAKEDVGTSNPIPKPQNLNTLGDSDPLKGQSHGAMTPFRKRGPSTPSTPYSSDKRYPRPLPDPLSYNEISHLLATRGNADGTIEYF